MEVLKSLVRSKNSAQDEQQAISTPTQQTLWCTVVLSPSFGGGVNYRLALALSQRYLLPRILITMAAAFISWRTSRPGGALFFFTVKTSIIINNHPNVRLYKVTNAIPLCRARAPAVWSGLSCTLHRNINTQDRKIRSLLIVRPRERLVRYLRSIILSILLVVVFVCRHDMHARSTGQSPRMQAITVVRFYTLSPGSAVLTAYVSVFFPLRRHRF